VARNRSLAELIADVRHIGDTEGATQRHTDEAIVRHLNQSIQAFRLMISSVSPYYLRMDTATLTAGNGFFTIPAHFVRVYGIDVLLGGTEPRELVPFQFSERNTYRDAWQTTGPPVYYRERDEDTIDVMPVADITYTLLVWHLPTGSDLADDGDQFDGIAGWEDWIVYDSALRTSTRDAGVNDNFELLTAELGRIQERILKESGKRHVPGTTRRVDTHGRRRKLEWASRWRRS
jgi:hypothetical protein